MIASTIVSQTDPENLIYICHNGYKENNQKSQQKSFSQEINRKAINIRFNLLLIVFIEIIKRPNPVLVHFFDKNFYNIIKEIEFTDCGLQIPGLKASDFQSLLSFLTGYLQNNTLNTLGRKFIIDTLHRRDSLTDDLLEQIRIAHNNQLKTSHVNSMMQKWSILSKLEVFEINFLLLSKYFPNTIQYNKQSDIVPLKYLLYDPFIMHTYCHLALKISNDSALKMILRKELYEFQEMFRSL